jgi:hypothetical protein
MNSDLSTADRVYYAIASTPGWDDVAEHAHFQSGSAYGVKYGRLISSILVAGGESTLPLAVTGILDENGIGHVALIYEGLIVAAAATRFAERDADVSVTAHGFNEISRVQLSTQHSFFSGSSTPREDGFVLTLDLGDARFTFPARPHAQNQLLTSQAAHLAYKAVRSYLTS